MKFAIWWIRRDFRLNDNETLQAVLAQAGAALPVFIQDDALWRVGEEVSPRQAFLEAGLGNLAEDLRQRASCLVVRRGRTAEVLPQLVAEINGRHSVTAVYAEEDFTPYARRRDAEVRRAMQIPLHLCGGQTILHPQAVLKADGSPYTVFTPYAKAWRRHFAAARFDLRPAPQNILSTLDVPSWPEQNLHLAAAVERPPETHPPDVFPADVFPAGEPEARRRLAALTDGAAAPLSAYAGARNFPAQEGTARLSPYFHFGMLSPRRAALTAVSRAERAQAAAADGAETWLNELIWRDFYQMILFHFPFVLEESFRPSLREIHWLEDPEGLSAWKEGHSGFPIVDAAMRQLAGTGWMHNRARMIVASFLTKDLLIDWRSGEKWFRRRLLDGDQAANNGGWQWSAGTGTDAAPFFRIFNPTLQGRKFDPAGEYICRWLPELRRVPAEYLHEPGKMPAEVQRRCGCIIGVDYPAPILDHTWARQRALAVYAATLRKG